VVGSLSPVLQRPELEPQGSAEPPGCSRWATPRGGARRLSSSSSCYPHDWRATFGLLVAPVIPVRPYGRRSAWRRATV